MNDDDLYGVGPMMVHDLPIIRAENERMLALIQSSSAGVPNSTAGTAVTSIPSPTAPEVAANHSKREQKPCQNCGKMMGRQVYKNGDVQSRMGFQRRKFCSLTCSAIVRNHNRART